MRLPKRGERGFTLIELLIVVAILGVLAAVVIPNVQRFMGAGKEEAAETELANIQIAVTAMMVDQELSMLEDPVDTTPTNVMSAFPDEGLHYVLWGCTGNESIKYVATENTSRFYMVDETGTVTQHPAP